MIQIAARMRVSDLEELELMQRCELIRAVVSLSGLLVLCALAIAGVFTP